MPLDEEYVRVFCEHIVSRARERGFNSPVLGYFAVIKSDHIDGYGFAETEDGSEGFVVLRSPQLSDVASVCAQTGFYSVLVHIDTESGKAWLRFYVEDDLRGWLQKDYYYAACREYYTKWVEGAFPDSHEMTLGTI